MFAWAVIVILIAHFNVVFSSCPASCSCPLELPKCAPGVSLVSDGCGCCKVCARQLNEDCSKTEPCDHTKGLECNFGAIHGATRGICRAKSEGRPCEYNSRIYQNGESFQPNCKHQCTCIDGAVGCIPLCPQELSLPTLGCANPRLVKVPGQCCEEWVCDDGKTKESINKLFGNDPTVDDIESDLTKTNELISIMKAGLKSLPAFRSQPESRQFEKCIVQTTPWSQCSKTCGTGISTRITNDNSECKLVKETRICEVRPCSQSPHTSLKVCNILRRMLQPEEVPPQVLRLLRGWPLLQPTADPHHPRQVPLRGRRDLQQERHDDRVLQVHLQLRPWQRSHLPLLQTLQRHPQVQRLSASQGILPRPLRDRERVTSDDQWQPSYAIGGPVRRPINYHLLL